MEGRSSIMPQKIFELTASLDEIEKRGLNDYEENVSGKVPIVRMDTPMSVAERYKVFVDGVGEMRDFFRAKYGPFWTEVSGCLSKWAVEDTVGRAIQEYLVLSQYYRKAVKKGK